MSTSQIEYRGKEFSASDSVLEVWLKLLVDEFDQLANRPDWLSKMRDDWHTQATQEFGYGLVPRLDHYLSTAGRRKIVLDAARRALSNLKSLGDPIPATKLNAVGAGRPDSPFPRDLPAELFLDPAEDFIDLLEEEDEPGRGGTRVITQEDLLQAIEAHATWLADATTGSRLKLKDARLHGANLSCMSLVRAKLTRVDLHGANLSNADLTRTELEEVSLESARLDDTTLRRAKIRRCNLDGASGERATIDNTIIEDTSLVQVRLQGARILDSTFIRVSMTKAVLTNAQFHASADGDLRGCDFSGSDLRDVRFRNADLRHTDFTETTLSHSTFVRVRLGGAKGLPFLADKIGGSELDFSHAGDGSAPGSLATLREQLGGGIGSGPWGSATLPEHYQAFRVDDGSNRHFSIERRGDGVEAVRVVDVALQAPHSMVSYKILDSRLVDSVAQDLILRVLLMGLLQSESSGIEDAIEYRNVGSEPANL